MTQRIPANDHGKIRVFRVVPPGPTGILDKTSDALSAALGTTALNPDFVDVFDAAALDTMSVADFLRQGYGFDLDKADETMLAGLAGIIILVMSRATGGNAVELTLGPDVIHVTTCGEGAQLTAPEILTSDAAKGAITPPPLKQKSDAAIGGRVAMVALVVMFAVFGLMIWVGG